MLKNFNPIKQETKCLKCVKFLQGVTEGSFFPEAGLPPNTDPVADSVVLVAAPPKERADPKDCPRPDPKPEELAGAAAAVVAAEAGAAPNAVELAAVVAAVVRAVPATAPVVVVTAAVIRAVINKSP